jgi:NADPH:quinone reductase-like Zn-dependent oxidoreductase
MFSTYRSHYGPLETIEIREVPTPEIKPDEALVRVHCTTVNRTDEGVLLGKPFVFRFFTGLLKPRYSTLGTDFAGEIVKVGSAVTEYQAGDRVFGFFDHGLPSQAQLMAISVEKPMRHIPESIGFQDAVASLEGVHYALNFINKLKLNQGEKILVYGGTGAIGSAAFQMLVHMGMDVTVVCAGAYVERLHGLGAPRVLDYQSEEFTQLDEQFHYVFDAVGKLSFGYCKPLLLPSGVYVSSELGQGGENISLTLYGHFHSGKRVVFPIPDDIKASMEYIIPLLKTGAFKPLIDRVYPLNQVQDAYRHTLSGQKIGNVILECQ